MERLERRLALGQILALGVVASQRLIGQRRLGGGRRGRPGQWRSCGAAGKLWLWPSFGPGPSFGSGPSFGLWIASQQTQQVLLLPETGLVDHGGNGGRIHGLRRCGQRSV